MPVILIHIDVPDTLRSERLRLRGVSGEVARLQEGHLTERQVFDALPTIADLRVDGSLPLTTVTAEILGWIRQTLAE
jgi:hypothetical protein